MTRSLTCTSIFITKKADQDGRFKEMGDTISRWSLGIPSNVLSRVNKRRKNVEQTLSDQRSEQRTSSGDLPRRKRKSTHRRPLQLLDRKQVNQERTKGQKLNRLKRRDPIKKKPRLMRKISPASTKRPGVPRVPPEKKKEGTRLDGLRGTERLRR